MDFERRHQSVCQLKINNGKIQQSVEHMEKASKCHPESFAALDDKL
jgi:hypothetical protein